MKRDMELIRRILIDIEAHDQVKLSDVSSDVLAHHILLVNEEQLIKGLVAVEQLSGPPILQQTMAYVRLTSKGHDFLGSVRDEGIWKKTMGKIAEVGGGISLSLVGTLATEYIKENLGLK